MALSIEQQINAIYNNAFGRNAKRGELDYYKKNGLGLLYSNLSKDKNAKGYYKGGRSAETPAASKEGLIFGGKFKIIGNQVYTPYGERLLNREERAAVGLATDRDWQAPEELQALRDKGYEFINFTPEEINKFGYDKVDYYSNILTGANKEIFDQAKNLLDDLEKRGQVINPNVEITPKKAAEFLKTAESEINPYYSTQLKLARESLLTDVGYDTQQIANFERDLEKQYIKSFRGIGEGAAEAGFAQSGQRRTQEGELMQDTGQQIQDTRSALEQQVGQLSRAFAQQYAGLPGFKQPNFKIAGAPAIGTNLQGTAGTFSKPSTQQSVYTLSPDIYSKLIGTSEFDRRGSISSRSSELESAYRTTEENKQLRQLTL